ncbi:Baeyer-Villiger monooxygenase [Diaporthe amygdali]|uniref:Baeyer-Villiger monooxygenase n=1 Tax=Phomopsis amygdali TaxID=1214568 RepID=UPI0022FEE75C|nr:Baeyer-Villiger monooxygenase [Diaporthe amygdali]KAJ0118573.1 Baeyer-Villiger monooxygenase [Diaporthe amygdali]
MGSESNHVEKLDALVVGAGFGGVYQLKRLRELGYRTKLVDSGGDYGGVWYWNRYPGARVDSTTPHYEFDDPALWSTWAWKQRFPDSLEIRDYFSHVAEVWDLRKDTYFNTFVKSASWDDSETLWTIETREGIVFEAKYFLLNTGFAAKRYIPDWPGIETFKGTFIHPSYWPHEDLDLKGKRVAIIGTGSTGVQLATELSSAVSELVIFQRTPNTALPMKQVNYKNGEQALRREAYPELFKARPLSFSGFSFSPIGRNTFDDPPEKRLAIYEALWKEGDFKFWLANYQDLLSSKAANNEAYSFWRDKTRAKIHDPRKQDLLAPITAPYSFGCKRISLEQGYFEIFNKPHIYLVDVNATPVQTITGKGIRTSEKEWEFDHIICATGFDSITGGLKQIDIKSICGESLADYWKKGTRTYLGMTVSGFPNMFFTYGPQGPTALCNGPTVSSPKCFFELAADHPEHEENDSS